MSAPNFDPGVIPVDEALRHQQVLEACRLFGMKVLLSVASPEFVPLEPDVIPSQLITPPQLN